MIYTYTVSGMTCGRCVTTVKEHLTKLHGLTNVEINLEQGEAIINMTTKVELPTLMAALPNKYTISKKTDGTDQKLENNTVEKSKLQQLRPLFLIFSYLFGASFLLNFKVWSTSEAMLDFMGLFYIVFSFFKFLDIRGFQESFRMYDPLANVVPVYGLAYPFIELGLGLLFLMRIEITVALITTILILGITTVGVTKTLLDKKSIRCACLGTALKLPMTQATFIENAIMLVMAFAMLFFTL